MECTFKVASALIAHQAACLASTKPYALHVFRHITLRTMLVSLVQQAAWIVNLNKSAWNAQRHTTLSRRQMLHLACRVHLFVPLASMIERA